MRRRKAEALDQVDAIDRRPAEVAALVVLTKPAALILRYERDAWRRFRESMKAAGTKAPEGSDATRFVRADAPMPRGEPPPRQPERPAISDPVTPAMMARAEQIAAGGFEPRTPEEFAELDALIAALDAREAALDLPPIEAAPVPAASRPRNRQRRRALAARTRCG